MDYVAQVAEFLKRGESVVFYTVSRGTFLDIKELELRFGLRPSAVCDRDSSMHGRAWKGLGGVAVISPEEALQKFPKTRWYITSVNYRHQIIGYLTQECGISPEYIINYEPVHKIKSCMPLQRDLYYDYTGELSFCCNGMCPRIPANEKIDAAGLRKLRDELLKMIEEDRVPSDSPCAGCAQIKETFYPKVPKGRAVGYFCDNVCNYRCSYCTIKDGLGTRNAAGHQTMNELIDAFKQEDMLDDNFEATFTTAGEPTLYPGRKAVYQGFEGDTFVVNSNGYLFDQDLFDLMNRKKVLIITSVDAGTRETCQKIKGVDGFERVRENLKKYAQSALGIVAPKYIFIPGDNDKPEEIDGFIEFCVKTGSAFALASPEFNSISRITEQTNKMVRRLAEGLSAHNILCMPYALFGLEVQTRLRGR